MPIALTHRPELEAQRALVQATVQRLRQKKLRPLIPSVLIRGASTNPAGALGFGSFGGGLNDRMGNFDARLDYDAQLIWELSNLGLGKRARVQERRGEHELAVLEVFRTQDHIAAEVAHTRAAAGRLGDAEPALADALDSLRKNMDGLNQTRRLGEVLVLVVRPQEVVAALPALAWANADYLAAVGDYNRAQFRLCRALGHPAQALAHKVPGEATPQGPLCGPGERHLSAQRTDAGFPYSIVAARLSSLGQRVSCSLTPGMSKIRSAGHNHWPHVLLRPQVSCSSDEQDTADEQEATRQLTGRLPASN